MKIKQQFKMSLLQVLVLGILIGLTTCENQIRLDPSSPFKQQVNISAFKSKTYNLSIDAIPKDSYLYVVASSLSYDPLQIPNLRVESSGEAWECQSKDKAGLCIIASKELTLNQPLFVTAQCFVNCSAHIEIYTGFEFKMQMGEQYNLSLGDHPYEFVATLTVPRQVSFTELNILATVNNPGAIEGAFQIYANVGKDNVDLPNKSTHKWKGVDVWSDGKGIFLKNGEGINPGDTIKFLLEFPARLSLSIQSYTINGNSRNISVYKTVKDTLPALSTRLYYLDVSQYVGSLQSTSLVIKLIKYSGFPEVDISADEHFENRSKILKAFSVMSTSSFVFPAWKRKDIGIYDKFYIRVQTAYDSAYQMTVSMNMQGFMLLFDGDMEVSSIEGDNIDNILFYYDVEAAEGTTPERARIDIKIHSQPNSVAFSVTRCKSLQKFIDTSCLFANTTDFKNRPEYYQISGRYMQVLGNHYYYFEQNGANCEKSSQGSLNRYTCIFQIVIWKDLSIHKSVVDYEIEVRRSESIIPLEEGFSSRGNIDANQFKRFSFKLPTIKSVKQVRFHLTTISGNSFMYVSKKSEDKLEDYEYVVREVATFTQNFVNEYYIAVQAIELSHFSLIAIVTREPQAGRSEVGQMMTLDEGIAHTFTIDSNQTINCGISLPGKMEFTVSVEHVEGMHYYYVTPIENGSPVYTRTVPGQDIHLTISPQMINYPPSNEFIVTVHAIDHPATVSVSYSLAQTGCKLFSMGKPITRSFSNFKQGECLAFHLTKLEDMEIVITTPSLSLTLDNLNISYKVNSTQTKIKNRFTKITKDDLRSMCPLMLEKKGMDKESCSLSVKLDHLNVGQPLTIIVQYTGSQIVLFDGIIQRVKGKLSNTTARHFYYTLNKDSAITVFIRSKTNNFYKVLGQIVDFADYSKTQTPYPKLTSNEETISISSTTQSGLTALVISSSDIDKINCTDCVLLLSVFSKGLESEVDFRIEVSQATIDVSQGETRQGYVENATSVKYQLASKKGQQTIVTLNSLHQDCAKLQVFSRPPNTNKTSKISDDFSDNYAILPAPNKSLTYLVEVTGTSSCAYQVSFTSTKLSVYELHEGVGVDILLDQKEKAYLLYYHSKAESFRLLSMAEYGDVVLEGEPLNVTELSDIENLTKNIKNKYALSEPIQSGFLQISRSHKAFCTECYYLFRMTAKTNLSTTILLHSEGSSVPLREGKLIKQSLEQGDYEQYVFYSPTKFNVTLNLLFGKANVTIFKEGVVVIKPRMINGSSIIVVPNKMTQEDEFIDGYDPDNEFSIKVQSVGTIPLGYIISAASNKKPLTLSKGIPLNFHLESKQCILIPSYTGQTNLSMMLESQFSIDNINYYVNFQQQDEYADKPPSNPLEHVQQKGQYNVLLKMSPRQGVYTMCLEPKATSCWVSVFILGGNMPTHLTLNSEVMVKTVGDDLHIFEIYIPTKGWMMFEGFECRGEVNIIGSEDYKGVAERKPQMKFIHTKTAGHYVGKAKVEPGLYFMAVEPRRNATPKKDENLAIVKYSMYSSNEFPYDKFEIEDEGQIKYEYDKIYGGLNFKVKKVAQQGNSFSVMNHYYRLYISTESQLLREASQCHTAHIFNKTVGFGAILQHTPDDVIIHLTSDELNEVTAYSSTIFASIISYVEVNPKQKHNSDIFRFSYDQIQLTVKGYKTQSTAFKLAIFIGLPSFVGLVVLFLALRFCVRKIYMADTRLVEEDGGRPVTQIQVPQTTGNVLEHPIDMTIPGTGMMSVDQKNTTGHADITGHIVAPLPSVSDR